MTSPDLPLPVEPEKEKEGLPAIAPDGIEQENAEEIDNIIPTRGFSALPMVALGGSAGSIPALVEFFREMPAESGMVFVVILHLSPTHDSILPEVLGRSTTMPVVQAQDGQKVEVNRVYVIPPGKHLTTVNGHLRLSDLSTERGKRVAVDLFFRSLADTHGPHAAAVVLSGVDGDGALGIKRIKERGGLTIAQDPDQAEYGGMPRAAIDTGMIDWVLGVAEMPRRLLEYRSNGERLKLPPEDGPQVVRLPQPTADESETALRDVLGFLRMRTGRDFSCYKRATILRRLARRMQVNGVDDLPSYLGFLRTHPGEAGALLQDLLITVTNFFRDRTAFEALEAHIPKLFADKHASDVVRVWVPACATGEEAYSLAMLLLEHARLTDTAPVLQVFACDLDEGAIQTARAGLYPEVITADVSEERLRLFFVKEKNGYRVRRELREMVLFAVHDLLKDPPFSRMDLISCRNLLIYLERSAQKRALDTFHFALKHDGLLFLGTSESVDDDSPLFQVLDRKYRIYGHLPAPRVGLPVPTAPSHPLRPGAAPEREQGPVVHGKRFTQDLAASFQTRFSRTLDRAALTDLHFRLLEHFGPPSVVITSDHDILHLSEHAGRFLQIAGGEPTMNLLRVVNPMLRLELRGALFRATETNAPVEVFDIPARIDGESCTVNLRVLPAEEVAPGCLVVLFDLTARESPRPDAGERKTEPAVAFPEPVVRHLERELEQVKGHLRGTVEQYEASLEELKASNEELQAMNEELRSATEELETSREELQSINEELTTVNQEMKGKMDELANANSDLQNLMASTAIGTVFLDRDLAITRYTPTAVDLFHLIPTDIGRPLGHLQHRLDYPQLLTDAEQVLRTLVPVEREVHDEVNPEGTPPTQDRNVGAGAPARWFLARLQPYRTAEDHIAGVVLTFVDVTERKQAERALASDLRDMTLLREVSERLIPEGDLQTLFDAILEAAVALLRADAGTVHLLDPATSELRLLAVRGLPRLATVAAGFTSPCEAALASGKRVFVDFDPPVLDPDRSIGLHAAQSTPLVARSGRTIGMLSTWWRVGCRPRDEEYRFFDLLTRQAADAIDRKQAEEELRASEERLRLLIHGAQDYAIFGMDPQRRVTLWNPGAAVMFGYSEKEILGQSADILFTPEDRAKGDALREVQLAREEGRAENERWHQRKDGSVFFGSGSTMPLRDDHGLRGFVKIMRDLTERKRVQEALHEQLEELTRFNAVAVDREARMIELKKEINGLCARLQEPARYALDFEREEGGKPET